MDCVAIAIVGSLAEHVRGVESMQSRTKDDGATEVEEEQMRLTIAVVCTIIYARIIVAAFV